MDFLFKAWVVGILAILAVPSNPTSPTNVPPSASHYCGQEIVLQKALEQNEDLRRQHEALEEEAYRYSLNRQADGRSLANYTLPIVIHIIHNNGSENIPDAQVIQGVQHLNEAFANTGYYDQGTGVNTEIEFCLARRDPDGNTTTGINRVVSSLTAFDMDTQDIALKDLSRWDPYNYINIWLVDEICSASIGCGVAGYAFFPSSHGGSNDGIVIEANWMGSSNGNSTVLAHEVGHYLGLYHTFQGACVNDDCLLDGDRVCDTPPDQSTAAVPCNSSANTCSTDVNPGDPNNPFLTDQDDMFWNYMDYGDWNCYSAFTAGQTARMEFFINGTRASLLDSDACQDPCLNPIAAGFTPSGTLVDVGATVNFTNTSTGVTNYQWTIDGTPFSTTPNASYTFNTAGAYNITLNATNADPNCYSDSTVLIIVTCPVLANFSASSNIAAVNDLVTFTNNSSNATSYNWTVNGTSESNATDFSLSLTTPSVIQVCLEVNGPLCGDVYCEYVSVFSPPGECEETFVKIFDKNGVEDQIQSIIPSEDGGYYMGGSQEDKCLIIKVDSDGFPIWERTLKVGTANDVIRNMELDSEDNLVFCGTSLNTSGTGASILGKYNPTTDVVLWSQIMPQPTSSRFLTILEAGPGGNYLISGQIANAVPPGLGCDGFLFEANRNTGAINWMKAYELGSCETISKMILYNNQIYGTGRYNNAGGGTSAMRAGVSRLNLAGDEIWSRLYPISPTQAARIYSTDLLVDNDQLVVVANGDDNGTSASNVEIQLFKTDLDGNAIWAKRFDIIGATDERTRRVLSLNDGYLLFGYYTLGDRQIFALKTDKQGNLQWAKSFGDAGTDETAADIFQNGDFLTFVANKGTGASGQIYFTRMNLDGELDSDCAEIEDLMVMEQDYPNPYDNLHPLLVYSPNYTFNANNIQTQNTQLANIDICSPPCISDCIPTYIKTLGNPQIDEGGSTIIPADDGNFFLAGYAGAAATISKITPAGAILWTRSFDFTDQGDRINYLQIDTDNNLIGCGFGGFTIGSQRGFAFKYDFTNDLILWSQTLSPSSRAYTILEPNAGGDYLLMVDNRGNSAPGFADDAAILGLERNSGATTGLAYNYNLGGSEVFRSTIVFNNALYAVGRYTNVTGLNKMRSSVSQFDFNGNEQWSRLSWVNPSGTARLYGRDIIEDGGSLISCASGDDNGTSSTNTNCFLSKHETNGDLTWVQKYDIADYNNEWTEEVIAVSDGYIMYGYNRSGEEELFLIKTDKDGNVQWAKGYGGIATETTYFTYQSQLLEFNGSLYFVGSSNSFGNGDLDVFILKTDLEGNAQEGCEAVKELMATSNLVNNPANTPINLIRYNSSTTLSSTAVNIGTLDLPEQEVCLSVCEEICGNGTDDDGDLLIDYYDPDCPCVDTLGCGTPFYNLCPPECEVSTPTTPIELDFLWTNTATNGSSQALVADVDGDCVPDVVAWGNGRNEVHVIDSRTGVTNYTFTINNLSPHTQPALADTDRDGYSEIYVNALINTQLYLVRLDFNPVTNSLEQTWQSSTSIFTTSIVPQHNFTAAFADFDHNGTAEVYIGNQIYASSTGLELVDGGNNNQGCHGPSGVPLTTTSIVADVLRSSSCVFCQGLELVAGGQVYTVNIASYTNPSLNDMTVEKNYAPAGMSRLDGQTRVADFDGDGDLDGIVSTEEDVFSAGNDGFLFIWDLQTETLLGEYTSGEDRVGPATIANLDDDPLPEMILLTSGNIRIFDDYVNGGGTAWGNAPTTEIAVDNLTGAGIAGKGAICFDLNGDGTLEIIANSASGINIYDNQLNLLFSENCVFSGFLANPIVADIDADNQAELICGCADGMRAYQSANLPWQNARRIWNQFNYFVVNVHDDGTIPIQQQQAQLLPDSTNMNAFYVQQPMRNFQIAGDASVSIDTAICNLGFVALRYEICNIGGSPLSDSLQVAYYTGGSPLATTPAWSQTLHLETMILPGDCITVEDTLFSLFNETIYVVVNDDNTGVYPYDLANDFPITSIGECDYLNNIDSVDYYDLPPVLELGPDITVCENGVFEFDAGTGFAHYEWQDGSTESTFTAWAAGTFWVNAYDDCGNPQSDTVSVIINPATVFDLGPDTIFCGVGTVAFSVPGFDTYEWTPSAGLDCNTCPTVVASPSVTTTYTLVAGTGLGCLTVDSVSIVVGENFAQVLDTALCQGESLSYQGQVLLPGNNYNFNLNSFYGCDSTISINITSLDTFYTQIDTVVCQGESIFFDGVELFGGSMTTFAYNTFAGCDSTILVHVIANNNNNVTTQIDTSACNGESVFLNGLSIPANSIEVFNYQTVTGCDSTVTVIVAALDTFYHQLDTALCQGESLIYDGQMLFPGNAYTFDFNTFQGCDSTVVVNVLSLDTFYTQLDTAICLGESLFYQGQNLLPGNAYTFNLNTFAGCDSTVMLNIASLDTFYTQIDTSICLGESIFFDGVELFAGDAMPFVYSNFVGCDSTIFVNVMSNNNSSVTTQIDTSVCYGETVFINGLSMPANSLEVFNYQTVAGCDSTVTVIVAALDTFYQSINYQICPGDSILIFDNYESSPGTYQMTYATIDGCDSTEVYTLSILPTLSIDLTAMPSCPSDSTGSVSAMVSGGNPPYQLSWSHTSDNGLEQLGLFPGTYTLSVSDAQGCEAMETIIVAELSEVLIPVESESVTCYGENDGALLIDSSFVDYLFSLDGITYQNSLSLNGLFAGTYDLFIQAPDGCVFMQSFTIGSPPELTVTLPADITLQLGDSVALEAIVNTSDSVGYVWSPPVSLSCLDCVEPTASPVESILYQVIVSDSSGCAATDEVMIQLEKARNVYIPNAFSPNGDGDNDVFMVYGGLGVEEILTFTIYDRWGEQLFGAKNFQPNDFTYGWDGTFKDKRMNPSVFVYVIEVRFEDGFEAVYRGDVTLMK